MKYWATCPHCGRKFFKYEGGALGTVEIKCPACKQFATLDLASENKIRVALDDGAFMPERAHDIDAGLDLRTPHDVLISAGDSAIIDTGVHVEIPAGYVGMLKSKSGLNVKWGVVSEGVIDAGYTGGIVAKLYNRGSEACRFERGDKITQLVVMPVSLCVPVQVERIDSNGDRGSKGFGSSGR